MAAERSEGTRLVRLLHSRGWTDQRIGKALGRNSSLIKQVRDGKKPGRNLVPALRTLRRGRTLHAQPERRTAKSGKPAKVRHGRVRTPSGRFLHRYTARQEKSLMRKLRTLANRGASISLHPEFASAHVYGGQREHHDYEVILYAHGGRSATSVLADIEKATTVGAGMENLATARDDVQDARGFLAVTIYEL